jgi:hypothetical protein
MVLSEFSHYPLSELIEFSLFPFTRFPPTPESSIEIKRQGNAVGKPSVVAPKFIWALPFVVEFEIRVN